MQVEGMKVFFSYARADSDFALRLAKDMRSAGVDIWIDQLDIPTGARWDQTVEDALKACPRFLIILSPASIASQNVMDEVAFAIDQHKEILPLFYQKCDIPFRLKRLQHIDFTDDYDTALNKLLFALSTQSPSLSNGREILLAKPNFLRTIANKRLPIIFTIIALLGVLGLTLTLIPIPIPYRNEGPIQHIDNNPERNFSVAIEKLKSNDANVRIEAIGALQRLGEDSEKYQPKILKALSSFVREQAPWKAGVFHNSIEKDVQLALTTIARIPKKDDKGNYYTPNPLDMHNVDISGANLENANLEKAIFWGSNLRKVILSRANLRAADLGGIDFTDASLEMADLEGALLWPSTDLEPKRPCIFDRTRLGAANLNKANLWGAILTDAYDLSESQVRQAIINEKTKLPTGITAPNFPLTPSR